MIDFVNRHLILPLVARKRNSRHLDYLRFLERTQFDPPAVVQARQLEMLKAMLRHAWDTVPYYRTAWQAAKLHPADVSSLSDFARFPVVTKTDIRTRGEDMVSTAYDRAALRVKKTSGSTGVPLAVRIDEPAVQWKYACTVRADQWSGYRLGQRVAKVWGNPEYRQFGLRGRLRNYFIDRAIYLDTIPLTSERMRAFAEHLRRHRPGLIFGHAHSLYLLARELKRAGISDVRPNGVISTAMPLHDWQRAVMDEVFGVPTTNRYGCEEVSLIACECERHQGLHVAAESVYTEIEPSGHLLVTDLSNYAMPLIRYRVGDVVTSAAGPCSCGRGLPLLGSIMGRDADYVVTPNGSMISGISLTENFAVLVSGVAQMQLVQEEVTFLRVRMVPDETFTVASRQQIANLVSQTFGPQMRHEVELVDAIPQDPSGKYRFCISKVAAESLKGLLA